MEKEFVPYNLSLELKKLGFDEECFGYYVNTELDLTWKFSDCSLYRDTHNSILAPLYQQAFRWFREKYKLQAEILWRGDMECFCYKTGNFKYGSHVFSEKDYKTYEEAELECLKKLIEIIKKK